ncbi:MAG: vWA domain-containing protein [Candidatus Latescibacterota bacterium]
MKQVLLTALLTLLLFSASLAQAPRIDVVFLLDSTGSMGDEIGAVKERIREMISEIALGDPAPDVRFGIVTYRDRGDEYVTKTFDLTADIDRIVENLAGIEANGGGDYPESLNEALHVTLSNMNWDPDQETLKLVFLIADAPPQLNYPGDYSYTDEIQVALDQWIIIYAIGCSGLGAEGVRIFTEIAEGTEGVFEWLTYENVFIAEDGDTVIVSRSGPEVTYTKGDSTWTGDEGEFFAREDWESGTRGEAMMEGSVSGGSKNDLGDLITSAIKGEAERRGISYEGTASVTRTTWGQVKATFIGF